MKPKKFFPKNAILILLILISKMLFAQKEISCFILDSITTKPIAFVNVGILSKNIGGVSDQKGQFQMEIPDSLENSYLTFSMIGYKTKHILIPSFSQDDTIRLSENKIKLDEVILTKENPYKTQIIGNKIPKFLLAKVFFKKIEAGNELAIKIKNNKKLLLNKLNLYVVSNDFDQLNFRINIYNIKKGYPYKRVNRRNIYYSWAKSEGIITIDLRDYHLHVQDDFFVSVELLNSYFSEENPLVVGARIGGKSFVRKTSQADWSKVNFGTCIFLDTYKLN